MKRGAANAETIRQQLASGTLPFPQAGDGIKTCLRCGKQLLHRLTRFSKAARKTRTGLCPGCNCRMARQQGIVLGPKGSLIDRDQRKEGDPHSRWVKCAGPCGKWMFRAIKTWIGVCDSCLKTRFDNEELSNGGWIIRDEKDAEGNRLLYYLYPPRAKGGCGCKRPIRPRTATHYAWAAPKGKPPKAKVPLICQPHRLNPFMLLSEQFGVTVQSGEQRNGKQIQDAISAYLPKIKEAKKLAKKNLSNDWRVEVRNRFPDLEATAIEMLISESPSAITYEQVGRSLLGVSGRQLLRRRRSRQER